MYLDFVSTRLVECWDNDIFFGSTRNIIWSQRPMVMSNVQILALAFEKILIAKTYFFYMLLYIL